MRLALTLLLAVLPGCASLPGQVVPVQWVQLEEGDLQKVCGARVVRGGLVTKKGAIPLNVRAYPHSLNGCFDWVGGVCVVYTRQADDQMLLKPRFQQTFGHEVIHCFKGLFHSLLRLYERAPA